MENKNMKNEYDLKLKISNGKAEEIYSREKNIWIGVSISLKEYSDIEAQKYLKFATKYSKEKAFVVIADDIAAINNKILGKGYEKRYPLEMARATGDLWKERYQENIRKLKLEKKVEILRWRNIWTEKREEQYQILKKESETNLNIRHGIIEPMIYYLKCRGRNANQKRIDGLSEYVLRELPFLLDGIEYSGIKAKCLFYPSYNMKQNLTELSCEIQKNPKFEDLRNRLDIKGDLSIIDTKIEDELFNILKMIRV
ncbi:MAG: hypothetical protein KC550_01745 [Nanoarchaeota archaeon]|nr:hypothetical protein [Nanoarchaeota archaeon]